MDRNIFIIKFIFLVYSAEFNIIYDIKVEYTEIVEFSVREKLSLTKCKYYIYIIYAIKI